MCMTLGGLVIPPLDEAAFGPAWRERKENLRQIVDEVTRRFFPPGERSYPMQNEPGYDPFRYFSGGDADPGIACSFGIGTQFADEGGNSVLAQVSQANSRILVGESEASWLPIRSLHSDRRRHIWLPLAASPDAAGPELVEQLAAQISDIVAASSPGPRSAPDALPTRHRIARRHRTQNKGSTRYAPAKRNSSDTGACCLFNRLTCPTQRLQLHLCHSPPQPQPLQRPTSAHPPSPSPLLSPSPVRPSRTFRNGSTAEASGASRDMGGRRWSWC